MKYIRHNNELYLIKFKKPEKGTEQEKQLIDRWKEFLEGNIVFRKDNYYFFCSLIECVEYEELI